MKLCYIAGKFRGENHWEIHQNVIKAEMAIPKLLEMGYAPICPHKLTENLQGLFPDQTYLEICLEILKRCDSILMLSNWKDSVGSCEELRKAKEWNKEILFEDSRDLYERTDNPPPFDYKFCMKG